jgi:hypothetical protein
MRRIRDVCGTVVEKPFGKCPFGRPGRKWENNVRIFSGKVNYEGGSDFKIMSRGGP